MPRVTFRLDIMCVAHSKPTLVGRRYYATMTALLEQFECFTPAKECPWHSNESLIPRFGGPSSYEASFNDVEESHDNVLWLK